MKEREEPKSITVSFSMSVLLARFFAVCPAEAFTRAAGLYQKEIKRCLAEASIPLHDEMDTETERQLADLP